MGLLSKIFSNTRKPEGFWGRMMVNGMNGGSHAALATWAMDALQIPQDGEIIDIGCGGGANVSRLLARSSHAKVYGVDYSPVSVEKSSKVNADAIGKGRCEIQAANVAALIMVVGVVELVRERILKLDRILPKNSLFLGFGALTLGGLVGFITSIVGYFVKIDPIIRNYLLWMAVGSVLLAVVSGYLFSRYKPQ